MDTGVTRGLDFPKGFFWGSSTSAHQVEGGNRNDWSEWEKANAERLAKEAAKKKWPDFILKNYPNPLQAENYISGKACDHYNRFKEDFDIAKSLGHNAHRFSIEWSRIEPEEGKFNEKEIEHYRQVIRALKERGMEPFVTLWHWTNPIWVRDFGGEENVKFIFYFTRFAKYVSEKLPEVKFWITLNEPTAVIANGYLLGNQPPAKKNARSALRVFWVLLVTHRRAYRIIHSVAPGANVGFANFMLSIEPYRDNFVDTLVARFFTFWANKFFLKLARNTNDFMTLQYYCRIKMKFPFTIIKEHRDITDLGWEIYPPGIYYILKNLKQHNKPIYITENGLADARDQKRAKFIKDHMYWTAKAITEGADVRGYFYWSLLDNFEMPRVDGFWPRFGLVEIDYKTLERKIRPSARVYKEIVKKGLSA